LARGRAGSGVVVIAAATTALGLLLGHAASCIIIGRETRPPGFSTLPVNGGNALA
jgi:hypothetical protein